MAMKTQIEKMQWWGYRHINGGLHLKRYLGYHADDVVRDAETSPFVDEVFGPFEADSRQEAEEILKKEAA